MGETLTSGLMWRAAGVAAVIDAVLLVLVARVPPKTFATLRWHVTGAAFLVYALLWGVFGSALHWDQVYGYLFPSWSRWLLPPWYGLVFGVLALVFWRIAARAARWPAVWFCVLGGLSSLAGHGWGIARGLLRVPMLSEVSASSALVFGVFEFVVYWSAIVGLALLTSRALGTRPRELY